VLTKLETTPNLPSESRYLKELKRVVRVVPQDSGLPEKPKCLPNSTKNQAAGTVIKMPTYEPKTDGNVFEWVLYSTQTVRELRRIERHAIEKAAAESEIVDSAKVED
jgi:hypothetical protein